MQMVHQNLDSDLLVSISICSLLLFSQVKEMRGWGKDKEGNKISYMVTEGTRYTDVVYKVVHQNLYHVIASINLI